VLQISHSSEALGTLLRRLSIAVFPILADVVEVKTVSRSTAHWRIHFIRLNGWLRHSFAQLITLLDIDGIGQNWEDSNNEREGTGAAAYIPLSPFRQSFTAMRVRQRLSPQAVCGLSSLALQSSVLRAFGAANCGDCGAGSVPCG